MNEHHEQQATPEAHEAEPRDGPRIYVASLSDYNNGILHGSWIDAVAEIDTMQEQIDAMLQASPTTARYGDVAEEWAIHDYDGFGDIRVDENQSLSTIARWAKGLNTQGLAFGAWVAFVGEESDDSIDQFDDRYQGQWESVTAYAEYMLDELDAERTITNAPEWLQPYLKLDVDGFARDLEISGDIITAETPEGGVWVWSGW
jgi:antirestriction protein